MKQIQSSVQYGRFELKKGNTMATLALVMNENYRGWYGKSRDVSFDAQAFDQMYSASWQTILNATTFRDIINMYHPWVHLAQMLTPYYVYFFQYYRPTQKLHVLQFMTNH